MGQTTNITMTGDWLLVATGPGIFTFSSDHWPLYWCIQESDTAPNSAFKGHLVKNHTERSVELTNDERLFTRSTAGHTLTLTAGQ